MSNDQTSYDFAIIGGGILGVAVAALASAMGYSPVVFRLKDGEIPRADTLRNQAWLQSGVMYPLNKFSDVKEYQIFAKQTLLAGRNMLRDSGLIIPTGSGIVSIKDPLRIEELRTKAKLLELSQDHFRQLETDEAKAKLEDFYDEEMNYFHIPDAPFDEAGVLDYLRKEAMNEGAKFIQVTEPVEVERKGENIKIKFDGNVIETPVLLIAAGTGSFSLLEHLGERLNGYLRRTPLWVGTSRPGLPASVLVDYEYGFSAVQHQYDEGSLEGNPVVIGTRARLKYAPSVSVDGRSIPLSEQSELQGYLPQVLKDRISSARYTAGYEVIPNVEVKLSEYQPWIEDFGNVLFASPGRATVAQPAAYEVMEKLISKLASSSTKIQLPSKSLGGWNDLISMHYQPNYKYCDAEK